MLGIKGTTRLWYASSINNDLGFVSTERRYEAPMCCTPGASK